MYLYKGELYQLCPANMIQDPSVCGPVFSESKKEKKKKQLCFIYSVCHERSQEGQIAPKKIQTLDFSLAC